MKRVFKSFWFWLIVAILLVLGYRARSTWLETRQDASVEILPGVKLTVILDPSSFPPLEDLEPNAFDIAPDGSFVFRRGNKLVLCDPKGSEPYLSVLLEQDELENFIFDGGGSLLTIAGGQLSAYSPNGVTAPESHGATLIPFDSEPDPAVKLVRENGLIQIQYRGGRPVPDRGVTGQGGARGYGVGPGRAPYGSDFHNDRGGVRAGGGPAERQKVYALPLPDTARWPREAEPALLLPSTGMRLGRTSKAGEILLYGGINGDVGQDVYLVTNTGTTSWIISSELYSPLEATAANGHLYVQLEDSIVHLKLEDEHSRTPDLVLRTGASDRIGTIRSIAVDPTGKVLYFSTDRKVYGVFGALIVKILDGLGGVVRTKGDTVYLFCAERHTLIAISGITGRADS